MVPGEWHCSPALNVDPAMEYYFKFGIVVHFLQGNDVHYNDTDSDHAVVLSSSWNVAPEQYDYSSDPKNGYINGDVIKISSYEELQEALDTYNVQMGDLLYWVQQNDGRPDHATIISDVKENKLYFAGNTSARFDKEVTADYFLEYQYFYIVRLKR